MDEKQFLKDITEIHDEWFGNEEMPKLTYNKYVVKRLKEKGYNFK